MSSESSGNGKFYLRLYFKVRVNRLVCVRVDCKAKAGKKDSQVWVQRLE